MRIVKAKRSQQVSVIHVHVISPTYPFRLMLKFIATLSMDIFLTFFNILVNHFFNDNFIEKAYKKFVKKNIKNFYMEYIFFLIISVILLN